MKLQGCKTEHGNASAFIGYLMRTGESGLLCVSKILQDKDFQRDVVNLQRQQKTDFLTQFGGKLEWWQNRQLTDKDSSKVHSNRARILARSILVDDTGPCPYRTFRQERPESTSSGVGVGKRVEQRERHDRNAQYSILALHIGCSNTGIQT